MTAGAAAPPPVLREARVLVLLNAAFEASLAPMRVIPLHAFAYLTNVLAPVWQMPVFSGRVLKRRGGPFYPDLQCDIDRMVGKGMVLVEGLRHVQDSDLRWRVEAAYCLNYDLVSSTLEYVLGSYYDGQLTSYLQEVAFALSALSDADLNGALVEDATYSDPAISQGNVVDFAEWTTHNPSANAASYFDRFLPHGTKATPGERLHLYVRHLHRRLHAS